VHLPTPEDLRERRTELDLTQSELADRAGVSQPLIARVESGDVDPRLSTLRKIVEVLAAVEGDVVRARDVMSEAVAAVAPDDTVADAVDLMGERGFSQLPVLEDGEHRGIITTADVRHSDADPADCLVSEVMSTAYASVEPEATLDDVDGRLDYDSALFVVEDGVVVGIITEADVAARHS
jgi:predicted transcriptional regulator